MKKRKFNMKVVSRTLFVDTVDVVDTNSFRILLNVSIYINLLCSPTPASEKMMTGEILAPKKVKVGDEKPAPKTAIVDDEGPAPGMSKVDDIEL